MENERILTSDEREKLLLILKNRFEKNHHRHKGIEWTEIPAKLEANEKHLWSLNEMERTGGEPDIIGKDDKTGEYLLCDCSTESPIGRRSLCYDHEAMESRKENKPLNNAVDVASTMGIDILTEEQYRNLQKLGKFDLKTSSWLKAPEDIRNLGGAIFAEFRYGHIFVFHNSAQSYYAVRGFRGMLRI